MWRGGLGVAYLLPALSLAGASLATPCCHFHIPLIEPDVRIVRIRLSEKVSQCRPRELARPLGKADETYRCRLVSKQAAVASVVKLAQVSGFRDQETEIGNSKIHT